MMAFWEMHFFSNNIISFKPFNENLGAGVGALYHEKYHMTQNTSGHLYNLSLQSGLNFTICSFSQELYAYLKIFNTCLNTQQNLTFNILVKKNVEKKYYMFKQQTTNRPTAFPHKNI